jgi:hypothetical protein
MNSAQVMKQAYLHALAKAFREINIDQKQLLLYRKLIGLEIAFGKTEYGRIVHFKSESMDKEERTYAVTDKGFEFECEELLYLLRIIELRNEGIEIVYPEGTKAAQAFVAPKAKRKATIMTGLNIIHPSQFGYYK